MSGLGNSSERIAEESHTHTRAHTHTYLHAHTHTHVHMYTDTYTQAHIHTHARGQIQGGSNMTGTDLYVNKPHCAAAVRP